MKVSKLHRRMDFRQSDIRNVMIYEKCKHTYEYHRCELTSFYYFIIVNLTWPSFPYSSLFAVARVFRMKLISLKTGQSQPRSQGPFSTFSK